MASPPVIARIICHLQEPYLLLGLTNMRCCPKFDRPRTVSFRILGHLAALTILSATKAPQPQTNLTIASDEAICRLTHIIYMKNMLGYSWILF